MTITVNAAQKSATLNFTDEEWRALRYINRIDGSTAFKLRLEKMLSQRLVQKRERRKQIVGAALEAADPAIQQQIVTLLGIDFGDE